MASAPPTEAENLEHNRVETLDRYVVVHCTTLETVEQAKDLCEAMNRALVDGGLRSVLFDSRRVDISSENVRVAMWDWAQAAVHHDRVAIVTLSGFWRASANMTALSRSAKARSFQSVPLAEAWLRYP